MIIKMSSPAVMLVKTDEAKILNFLLFTFVAFDIYNMSASNVFIFLNSSNNYITLNLV